ncbi:isochorismatase family protein [Streptomyces olivaceoviridis]|uniref:isochorismatase family protein n=1 Tax=Streptomyces olivaceoviridis TaxID=1921 RepID=UPI0036FBE0E9
MSTASAPIGLVLIDTVNEVFSEEGKGYPGMIGTMCVESTARSAMERGYRVTLVPDATAPDDGPDSYEQMLRRYALIAHEVLTTDELLATRPFRSR